MARERGTSLLHSYEEAASFFGPRVPDVVRKMVPNLSKINKGLLRKLVQGKHCCLRFFIQEN